MLSDSVESAHTGANLWRAIVDKFSSWSFLLCAVGIVVSSAHLEFNNQNTDSESEKAIIAHSYRLVAYDQIEKTRRLPGTNLNCVERDRLDRVLSALLPERFVKECGMVEFLRLWPTKTSLDTACQTAVTGLELLGGTSSGELVLK